MTYYAFKQTIENGNWRERDSVIRRFQQKVEGEFTRKIDDELLRLTSEDDDAKKIDEIKLEILAQLADYVGEFEADI